MAKSGGSFKPGQSGNAGGRPKVVAEIRDLARQHTAEATGNVASEFSAFLRSLDEPREQTAATARLPQGVKRLN
jgi:hypothetical protein